MNKTIIYALIYISGVLISAFAQVLLKKSADIKKDNIKILEPAVGVGNFLPLIIDKYSNCKRLDE